jgi:hypothetical protein
MHHRTSTGHLRVQRATSACRTSRPTPRFSHAEPRSDRSYRNPPAALRFDGGSVFVAQTPRWRPRLLFLLTAAWGHPLPRIALRKKWMRRVRGQSRPRKSGPRADLRDLHIAAAWFQGPESGWGTGNWTPRSTNPTGGGQFPVADSPPGPWHHARIMYRSGKNARSATAQHRCRS